VRTLSKRLHRALSSCERLLQIALDFTKISDALRVAADVPRREFLLLEAGTPLIKSWGVTAVRVLRALPGEHLVVADTKTVDTGRLEASLMSESGADVVTVLAMAPEETIGEIVDFSKESGIAIYGDLIGLEDPLEGARKLRRLGVDVALLHVGIDVQKRLGLRASEMLDLISKVRQEFSGPVAVAGGIKPSEAGNVVKAGASIVIIGSGITKAADPKKATEEALKNISPKCL
jgi:3-hexulose-6-phosphate synthase